MTQRSLICDVEVRTTKLLLLQAHPLYPRNLRQPRKRMHPRPQNRRRRLPEEWHYAAGVDRWEERVHRHRTSSMLE